MLNSSAECQVASNCTTPNGAIRACYEDSLFRDEVFFCDCSVYFGWVGEECDEPTNIQILYKINSIIFLLWSSALIVLTGRTVFLNFRLQYNPKQGVDPIVFTGVFVLLSAICLFSFFALTVPTFFISNRVEIVEYGALGDIEEVVDETNGYIANILLYVSILLQCFSSLFMILSLDKTIKKLSRFHILERYQQRAKFKNRLLSCICVSALVCITILAATRYLYFAVVLVVIAQFLTSAYFIWSANNFVKIVKSLSATENKFVLLTTKLVRKTCLGSSFALLVISITNIAFAATVRNVLSTVRPGGFNHVLFIRDTAFFAGLFLLTVTAWYVNSVTEGVILADDCGLFCAIFKPWDKKNTQLMPTDTDILNIQTSIGKDDTTFVT